MILGYKIQCEGLNEPLRVKGDNFNECLRKFRNYFNDDTDVDVNIITRVSPIDIVFDIEYE